MAKKSTIIPLPMRMNDEKKYEGVVDILDSYEQELEDIYVRAGVVQKPNGPNKSSQPALQVVNRPHQIKQQRTSKKMMQTTT